MGEHGATVVAKFSWSHAEASPQRVFRVSGGHWDQILRMKSWCLSNGSKTVTKQGQGCDEKNSTVEMFGVFLQSSCQVYCEMDTG